MICNFIAFLLALTLLVLLLRLIYKKAGLLKTLLIILVIILIDSDHFFLTEQIGFMRVPEEGKLIFQLFHTIEFFLFIIILNIPFLKINKPFVNILFPEKESYNSIWKYYYIQTARILLLGVCLHYAMDIIFYTLGNKLHYYYYSIIQYILA
jgi:hypothetical protein